MVTDAGDVGSTLQVSMYLYEGTFTRRDVIRDDGKIENAGTYSAELKKGDIVQVCTTSGFDWTVMADYTDSGEQSTDKNSIGIIKTTPSGKVPNVSSNGGTSAQTSEANCRQATVEWPDYSVVREFVASNSENAGIPVGWDSGNGMMDSGQTNCPFVSIESSTAGSTCSYLM